MIAVRAAFLFAALVALTACSRTDDAIRGDSIACGIGGASFAQGCRLERIGVGKSALFVAHHPDGGFRRLLLSADGKGLAPADGADEASSVVHKDAIELRVGQDRYLIPLSLLESADDR